jgi:hypothetical protein
MRLLEPPVNLGPANPHRDEAAKAGFSLPALEALVRDCEAQPNWRWRADRAHAFYDMGKQLTPEREAKIRRDWGIEPRQTNLIHGVINGVLGQEAKSRSDVRVEADEDEMTDLCDVFNVRIKEATRESCCDMAVSNSYGSGVKGGLGWVEVSRASDPLDYPYRVRDIHRNEIWYDWRAKDISLNDARWQVRKRWEDLDEAIALMPQFKNILLSAVNGWDLVNLPEDDDNVVSLRRAAWNERVTSIHRDEWCDTSRRRIKFFEVWYRVPAEVVVMQVSPTRRIMFDEKNPLHIEAVSRGRVKLSKSITRQIRMALFAGPHRLIDVPTTRRRFPYVPFFAFRDDEDRSPYGLIEGMISPQEEYNERRQMWNWMLLARQVLVDSDALDTTYTKLADLAREVMRPDFMAVLNPNRKNANALKIGNEMQLQTEQFNAMQDSKQLIQEVPRVYGPQLGDAPTGVTSGYAINSLVEQGVVAMGELNDNYLFHRRMVHENLLDLIVEDHLEEELRVSIGTGKQRRVVLLNTWDPKTRAPVNRVKDAPMRVGLSDVPTSPAYRLQQQQQLATIIQGLAGNPQAMAILAPAYIEGSTLPNRQALADDLRRVSGVPVAGDRQAQAEAEDAAQAQRQEAAAAQQAITQAEVSKSTAAAEREAAEARLADARAQQLMVKTSAEAAQQQQAGLAANDSQLIEDSLAEALAQA